MHGKHRLESSPFCLIAIIRSLCLTCTDSLNLGIILWASISGLGPTLSSAQDCTSPPSEHIHAINGSETTFDALWSADTSFQIIERDAEGGKRSYRITGDIVKFDQDSFTSLARSRRLRFSNVAEIVIDAREIYFNGPLALNTGRIELLADHIIFGPKAQIIFTDVPTQSPPSSTNYDQSVLLPRGGGAAIVARQIDFNHPLPYLFYFATHENRDLQILAEKLFLDGERIQQADLFIQDRYLYDAGQWRATVIHRALARNLYLAIYKRDMNWPISFAAKIARFHAKAPYQEDFITGLRRLIDEYQPMLSVWRDPGPSLRAKQTAMLMDAGLDPYGHGPNYVPRGDLDEQIKVVSDLLNKFKDGGELEDIENLILAGYSTRKPDFTMLKTLEDREATLTRDASANETAMGEALTKAQELQQAIDTQLFAISNSIARIKAEIEDMRKKEASKAQIMQATHIATVAASFIPVTAPVAIAIGAGIEATGRLAAQHQTGDSISFGTLSEAVQDGYSKSKAFNEEIGKVNSSWSDLSKKHGTLKDALKNNSDGKIDAAKEFEESAVNFYKDIKDLYGMVSVPVTVQYNESNAEQNDSTLQQQQADLKRVKMGQSDLLATIADLTDKNRKNQEQELELNDSREQLLRADIKNDQDIAHWQSVALRLRADQYSALFREASILRRAIFYSTGRYPDIDPDIVTYADEAFVARLSFSKDSELPVQVSGEWIAGQFRDSRKKTSVAITGLLDAAQAELRRAHERRTPKAVYQVVTPLSIQSKPNSPTRRFIEALNRQISEQISRPETSNAPVPLYLPLQIRQALIKLPERFVDAVVTTVSLKDQNALEGKNLNFSIYNPGFGTVVSGVQCFNIDMRITDVDAENRFFGYTTVAPLRHDWSENIRANADAQSVQDRFLYARPPLHAPYYLTVQVGGNPDSNNWNRIPVITSLDITLVGIQ